MSYVIIDESILHWDWCRDDSKIAPSQWDVALLCNGVSHWLGASLESALWWLSQEELNHTIADAVEAIVFTQIRQLNRNVMN